jgi:hypothetical protein
VNDAINSACNAFRDHGIIFNTIALGTNVKGQEMLRTIADCSNGTYYQGDYENLFDLYQETAHNLLEWLHKEQTVFLNEGFLSTRLYPDSYIKFNYLQSPVPYGLYLYAEKSFTDDFHGSFSVPLNSDLISVSIVSYSGSKWTHQSSINNNIFYDLSEYNQNFITLGDPYLLSIPVNLVDQLTENNITLTTGLRADDYLSGSIHNKIIYIVTKNISAFSSISSTAQGCEWNIEFEDSTNLTFSVPVEYMGENKCYYSSLSKSYNSNDAYQSAVFSLLKSMDLNDDGKINFKFDIKGLGISSTTISGIPYSWSTEMQVKTWN